MHAFRSQNPIVGSLAAVALGCSLASTVSAQVSHGSQPSSSWARIERASSLVHVDAPNVAAYLAEDEAAGYRPLRYGALLDLDITIADGEWTDLPDGSRVWRIRITSPGAKSLAVEFDTFALPAGAEMFVYGQDAGDFLGAYNIENEHLEGGFVFEPFAGSEITLEIDVPAGVADPVIDTSTLIYDYRDAIGLMNGTVPVHPGVAGTDPAGACLIDVNCPQGDAWEVQKRATVRTLSGGSLCSGALMNNTAGDGTAYVLTADHCGQGSNTIFRFKHQKPSCGSGSSPTGLTVSGATVLTTSSNYDNRLLRITGSIPDAYEPYFAGWTRSTGNFSFSFSMGHPSGGPKKISVDANGAVRESTFWRVGWSEGTLEGGSSGGPLFDQDGRVRGPACCVNAFNCNQTAWYGLFDKFWNSNAVAQWLDPLGTNQETIDGYDPLDPCPGAVNYCQALSNSAGPGAAIGYTGSSSLVANDMTLTVFGVPPGVPGLFFYGNDQAANLFGDGLLCTTGAIKRLNVQVADVLGSVTRPLDLNLTPFDSGAGQAIPGETKNFQFWYRDVAGGGAGFNTSDAMSVKWCD
jgi:lysyl endopeptidase